MSKNSQITQFFKNTQSTSQKKSTMIEEKVQKQLIAEPPNKYDHSTKKNIKSDFEMQDEVSTPEIQDREEDLRIQSPWYNILFHLLSQLLYLTPNQIKEMWKQIQPLLQALINTNKLISFGVQSAVEDIFKLHFNMKSFMNKKINFGSLKVAIDQHPQKEIILNGAIQTAAKLCLKMDSLFQDFLPILESQQNLYVHLSPEQCACIVANMFFCTLHLQPDCVKFPPNFIMAKLFQNDSRQQKSQVKIEKIKCYLNYFVTIHKQGHNNGQVSFERRVLQSKDILEVFNQKKNNSHNLEYINKEIWNNCEKKLCPVSIKSSGKIEEEVGAIFVDFANKYIGGGVLGEGCVQEEILFLIYPEMLASVIITHMLERNESLLVSGVRRCNNYTGYADTFLFAGSSSNNLEQDITCIDAQPYDDSNSWNQYTEREISSELTKAFVGFKNGVNQVISTGRWGCGAFKGDWQLKFFIQWMSASVNNYQNMIFYNVITEQADNQKQLLEMIVNLCKHLTVGQLHKKVQLWAKSKINKSIGDQCDLITFLTIL